MAAPGSNSSQQSTPSLPRKPIPAPRNQAKSKFSANNVYQNTKNTHGKVNTSIYDIPRQNEVEHYQNLLQQKIERQSSQQSVAITTADILKLNVPFFSKNVYCRNCKCFVFQISKVTSRKIHPR